MSLRSSLSRLALALLVAGLVAAPGASAAPFESQGTVTQDARGEAAADPLDLPAYPASPARAFRPEPVSLPVAPAPADAGGGGGGVVDVPVLLLVVAGALALGGGLAVVALKAPAGPRSSH
ncbi:MAG: hypothetical protein ACAH82_16980 [Solirubrobacteraceae bacterium]